MLKIRNLGQINEAMLTFGDLTLLVGPQASGKSIALQLLKLVVDAGQVQEEMGRYGLDWGHQLPEFLDMFGAEKTQAMQKLANTVLEKTLKVFYFDRETGATSDISQLDPSAEGDGDSGWGGLSEFSGRANRAVARAVANSESSEP